MEAAGMNMDEFFVTSSGYDKGRDGPVFIYARYMWTRPETIEKLDKKKNIVHIILTGW
jgi:hypothetical protein